jgi:hypothetical protein
MGNNDLLMEMLAYVGSVVVFASFVVKKVRLLRILNNIGCAIFLAYAIYHFRLPLILLNTGVILVNLWHLKKGD